VHMAQPEPQIKLFEPDHVYLHWLKRRQAWPMRLDRVIMPWIWGLMALCLAAPFVVHGFLSLTRSVQAVLAGLASGAAVCLLWIYFRPVSPVLPAWLTGPRLRRFALLFLLAWVLCVAALLGYVFLSLKWNIQGVLAGLASGAVVCLLRIYLRRVSSPWLGRVTGPWLRRATFLFLVLWFLVLWVFSFPGDVEEGIISAIALMAGGVIVLVLPPIWVFLDFFLHVPRCVHRDTDAGMIEPIWHAPISTREIVRDLRRWAVAMDLRHLAPSIVLLLVIVVLYYPSPASKPLPSGREIVLWLLPMVPIAVVLWWFLLGCGLAAAALPRRWTAGILLIWVLPILVGVYLGGMVLAAELVWGLFPGPPGTQTHMLPWGGDLVWLCGSRFLLFLPPSLLTWLCIPKLMEMRRQGRWV
jgi:hypothetical protein